MPKPKTPKKATAKNGAPTPIAPRRKAPMGAKSAFVKSLPVDMPVAKVKEEGRKKGLILSSGIVYAARATLLAPELRGNPTVRLKKLLREVGKETAWRVFGEVYIRTAA